METKSLATIEMSSCGSCSSTKELMGTMLGVSQARLAAHNQRCDIPVQNTTFEWSGQVDSKESAFRFQVRELSGTAAACPRNPCSTSGKLASARSNEAISASNFTVFTYKSRWKLVKQRKSHEDFREATKSARLASSLFALRMASTNHPRAGPITVKRKQALLRSIKAVHKHLLTL